MDHDACWQCAHPSERSLFCKHCNCLQRPTPDYFGFFGIPPKLDLDLDYLKKRFYSMSRMLHPDRYTRRPGQERQYSLEATAILNDGYRVLRDPVARAEYILKENGFDIGEQRTKNVPSELLEEVFELNMALEELRMGDESVRPQLEQARAHFLAMRDKVDAELLEMFRQYDAGGGRETLSEIRGALNRRTYIRNLVAEVEKALAGGVSIA